VPSFFFNMESGNSANHIRYRETLLCKGESTSSLGPTTQCHTSIFWSGRIHSIIGVSSVQIIHRPTFLPLHSVNWDYEHLFSSDKRSTHGICCAKMH
jgi:hypothetical protein